MPLNVAKILTSLVVLLMVLEIIGAAVTAIPQSNQTFSFHCKKPAVNVFAALLFEKAEKESEAEEEKVGMDRVLLIDFSWVAHTLSIQFIPKVNLTPFAFQHDVRPPVYTLNCVFII